MNSKWSPENVRAELSHRGWLAQERQIEHGVQFALGDGSTKVNAFNTGKVQVQGKLTELKQTAMAVFVGDASASVPPGAPPKVNDQQLAPYAAPKAAPSRVFIVYGHDADAREQLELLLRRLKVEPIVLQNLPSTGDTIIEKLETLHSADFACVLLTPDDEGRKRGNGADLKPRARQNVVMELGMVLARLGRRHVAVLLKGAGLEKPSDIDGLIYLPFSSHVNEVRNELAANLQEAGFTINLKDLLA
jgi:predicted nucleotide-binding protein